jgi:UDP-glucose 4-epimerase
MFAAARVSPLSSLSVNPLRTAAAAPARRRILVTGGAGFIGSHLVRRLIQDGYEVHVLHRPQGDLRRLPPTTMGWRGWPCDLRDTSQITALLQEIRPQAVFHLAGDANLRHFDSALAGVLDSIERNLRTSMNLIVAAANLRMPELSVLVRVGGLEEYGRGPLPYTESQREDPVSPYSASQVAVTHYLQMLAARVPFRTVTIRPALIYGPGQATTFLIPALIDACRRNQESFRIATGGQGRDLLHVDDLVEALVRLLTVAVPAGEIINIGAEREYLMADVATAIVRLAKSNIRLVVNNEARPGQIEHLYCSCKKARDLLGWRPAIDLETGLRRTIDAYRPVPSP